MQVSFFSTDIATKKCYNSRAILQISDCNDFNQFSEVNKQTSSKIYLDILILYII